MLVSLWFTWGVATSVVGVLYPEYIHSSNRVTLWFCSILGFIAVIDALNVLSKPTLTFVRSVPQTFSVGMPTTVVLRITNEENAAVTLEICDHVPQTMHVEDMPQHLQVPAHQGLEVCYKVSAHERGHWVFPALAYRRRSLFGLWWRLYTIPLENGVRVYPDFKAVAHYTLMARDNRLNELGIHKTQRRGEGKDFHQLRDYRVGDALKQIDWKATSRLQRAITREYQDERDQQVIFVLDHGRRMHSRDGTLSHLDHALNAILLLSYVALRQGDAVGFLTFGRDPRFIPPGKGPHYVNTILNGTYDVQSSNESADPISAAQMVLARVKKRSLVVFITNIGDDDHSDMAEMVRALRTKHLVLLASLRERILADTLNIMPVKFTEALTTAAIHHYLSYRQKAHAHLNEAGAMSFDVEPHKLPGHLVNRYLHIKASGRL